MLSQDLDVMLSDHPDLATADKTVKIDAGLLAPIAITRTSSADEFIVTATECDHAHCAVTRNGSGWVCPCHGSRFQLDGTKTQGPARQGLWVYDWMLNGDVLTIFAP